MIRFQRSAQIRRGKHGLRWAREVTDYINTNYPHTSLQLFRYRFGDVSTICWMADFEDWDSLDDWQYRIGKDKDYHDLRRQSLDILVEGSITDTLLVSAA